jgi:histidinol-phosphate aminotransferase
MYALAGARIGYAIAGSGLDAFVRASARTLGFHRLSERLALAALDDEAYYAEIRSRMVRDRRRLIDALRAFDGVRAYESQANFVLARFPSSIVAPLREGLARRGYVPKFFTEPAFASCARITIGTEPEQAGLVEALRHLLPALLARAEEKVA